MSRIKTAYKNHSAAEEIPPPDKPVEQKPEAPLVDEASSRLQQQIADLRRSEEMLREAAQGWMPGEREFMAAHPELIQNQGLTEWAARKALAQGHRRGTEAFLNAVALNFHEQAARLHQRAPDYPPAPTETESPQETHEATMPKSDYFESPAPPPPHEPSVPYSAPVSRGNSGGHRNPERVRLTPEERAFAQSQGLSDPECAKGKIRLEEEKRAGNRQNG
jgi:hypothetical protein